MEKHLSKVVAEYEKDWDRHLLLFLLVYHSAVHDTTDQTPAAIVFRRELRLPCDIFFDSPNEEPKEVIDCVDENTLRP